MGQTQKNMLSTGKFGTFTRLLKQYKNKLTRQEILTLRGQAKKGEIFAAMKGLRSCLRRKKRNL